MAIIASARQTNEELYLISKLAKKLGAITDSVPRVGEADKLLLSADRNPNSKGARLAGIAAEPMGSNLPKIVDGVRAGKIKALIVFGEDATKCGLSADALARLDLLVVSDIFFQTRPRARRITCCRAARMPRNAAHSPTAKVVFKNS